MPTSFRSSCILHFYLRPVSARLFTASYFSFSLFFVLPEHSLSRFCKFGFIFVCAVSLLCFHSNGTAFILLEPLWGHSRLYYQIIKLVMILPGELSTMSLKYYCYKLSDHICTHFLSSTLLCQVTNWPTKILRKTPFIFLCF